MAYQQLVCASCSPAVLWHLTRISTNQSAEGWHHMPDSCTFEVFRVSPKHEFAHFYLTLFNNNFFFFFLHFENEIGTGIYEWE